MCLLNYYVFYSMYIFFVWVFYVLFQTFIAQDMFMNDKHIVNQRNREFVDSVFLDHSVIESSISAPPPHAAGNSADPTPSHAHGFPFRNHRE